MIAPLTEDSRASPTLAEHCLAWPFNHLSPCKDCNLHRTALRLLGPPERHAGDRSWSITAGGRDRPFQKAILLRFLQRNGGAAAPSHILPSGQVTWSGAWDSPPLPLASRAGSVMLAGTTGSQNVT